MYSRVIKSQRKYWISHEQIEQFTNEKSWLMISFSKKCVSNFCYKKWVILLQPQACKIVEESCIRKVSVISQIPHDAYEYKWWEIREMYSTNNKEKHIFHLEDILGIPNFWSFKGAKPMVLDMILKMMFDWADIKENSEIPMWSNSSVK